jgi:hypothetical protein
VGTLSLALRGAEDPLSSAGAAAARTVRTADLRLKGVGQADRPGRVIRTGAWSRGASGSNVQIYRAADASSVRVKPE